MNNHRIQANTQIVSDNGQHNKAAHNKRRFVQRIAALIALTLFFVALVLAGTGRAAFARQNDTVYLYQSGSAVLQPTDYYAAGHVYNVSNNAIGTCPDTTDGRIYNNGQTIGFISPSNTASAYFGP